MFHVLMVVTKKILYCVEPFLCNDHEMGGYTRVVPRQWLSTHVPAETDTHATTEGKGKVKLSL
jgi:hypothetical protein